MNGVGGLAAWQWLFILEGIPTVIGLALPFVMVDYPEVAPWLNEQERAYSLQRFQADANKEANGSGIDWQQVHTALTDYKTYISVLINFGIVMPSFSLSYLLPTIIQGMGFTVLTAQLLTSPICIFGALVAIANAYHSDRTGERAYHVVVPGLVSLTGYLLLVILKGQWARYALIFVVIGGLYACNPVNLSWATNNSLGKSTAAVTSAMVLCLANLGGFLAGQMYRDYEAPDYIPSHLGNTVCLLVTAGMSLLLRHILVRENHLIDQWLLAHGASKADERNTKLSPTMATRPAALAHDPLFRFTL
ncbi:hypothetical protein H4R34_004879 [Dimargaris verticillata]|uniref:Major facilitator superfamily domain-containing protein n=1 Tax=Dimargaris verticillata TaxID=2761393 RepID=A0A9W8B3F3_9FUNG|nr:hypothetical protein H4R34_004879 [Dimargaris verticillata]